MQLTIVFLNIHQSNSPSLSASPHLNVGKYVAESNESLHFSDINTFYNGKTACQHYLWDTTVFTILPHTRGTVQDAVFVTKSMISSTTHSQLLDHTIAIHLLIAS